MEYVQNFIPIGDNLSISVVIALIPIIVFLLAIVKKIAAWLASLITLIVAIVIAVRLPNASDAADHVRYTRSNFWFDSDLLDHSYFRFSL